MTTANTGAAVRCNCCGAAVTSYAAWFSESCPSSDHGRHLIGLAAALALVAARNGHALPVVLPC